ncbi:MAG TPA: SCO family protein [Sphingomicrobium sp.]|nr:SCO family protein [Sphingomicrobium sp.]
MRTAALLLGLLLLSPPVRAAVDPATFQSLAFRQHPGAQLPLDAEIQDSAGRPLSLASALGGKPAVVVLEYLHCNNLCSLVLSGTVRGIAGAGLTPGRDLNLVAISIDPRETARDAAAAQAMYAKRFPDPVTAAPGVRFFTGSPGEVRKIAEAIGFPYRYDRQSNQFLHPAGVIVTTPTGTISRYLLGLDPEPAQLKTAVAEAAQGEVKPPAHPLLCLCFGYDPDEGSVAALTWQLVRWASLALVLACVALVGLLSLRRAKA